MNSRELLDSIRDQKVERKTYSIYLSPVWEEFKEAVDADNQDAETKVSASEALESLMALFLEDYRKQKK
jgi:hypothetical protein